MNKDALLCIDSETIKNPFLIGLPDENLLAQSWLHVSFEACRARSLVFNEREIKKVWVVSCDDLDGINLAAALKRDKSEVEVCFLSFDMTGSVLSRCCEAGILPLDKKGFASSYSAYKAHKMDDSLNVNDSLKPDTLFGKKESLQKVSPISGPSLNPKNELSFSDKEECLSSPENDLMDLDVDDPLVGRGLDLTLEDTGKLYLSNQEDESRIIDKLQLVARKDNQGSADMGVKCLVSTSQVETEEDLLQGNSSLLASGIKKENKSDGYVLSVLSGSGGSGKSTVSVLLGLTFEELGYKTVIFDADFQFGDMSFLLGYEGKTTIQSLIEKPELIASIEKTEGLPALVSSPANLEYSELAISYLGQVVELLKQQFEVIVVNTGAFWNEQHARLLELSNKSLFLMDQRPSSIRSCAHALSLCARCGIASQNFSFVLNRCSRQALLTSIDVSCALKGVSVHELKEGGKEIGELLSAGLIKDLMKEKNAFTESIKALIPKITSFSVKEKSGIQEAREKQKGFRLLKRKRRAVCL